MKKNILALLAIVGTIVLSSFTSEKFGIVYLVFDGSGPETTFSNYSQTMTNPGTDADDVELFWFSVNDANNSVTSTEFGGISSGYFDVRDTDDDGILSDEDEIPGVLEKKEAF